ncbi:MAG: SDR family oxidoreductase [Candidatus Thiodiazotropha sp. (ex Monitilora ramsayi)]|nr:SDR family oxidoreductase [Candidatus Thiodiazotropha sp. (ex Monitilora ramsayi)]
MHILVLGVSGMLGNAVFRYLSKQNDLIVTGTLRNSGDLAYFPVDLRRQVITGVDVLEQDGVVSLLTKTKPDVVINCIGLIKQLSSANDPLVALPLNALFPHRLSRLCKLAGARLVHISTDCVFSGRQGNYIETDAPDAEDLYGKSKQIGELTNEDHSITLRTSIIGHELHSHNALIDWFLTSSGSVKGFTHAIFSGLPTIELARVIHNYVLPNNALHGLHHISVDPINKYDLLKLVADVYDKQISLVPSDDVVIDRSLNSERFRTATGYQPYAWPELIQYMHDDYLKTKDLTDV